MALYLRLIGAAIRTQLQYKWDFLFSTLFYGVVTAIDFLTVAAILHRYPQIGGWNLHEIALLSGIAACSYSLYRSIAGELDTFQRYLIGGEFDSILIRPWPSLLTLLARNFDTGRIGGILQGLAVMTFGLQGVLAEGAPRWLILYLYTLPLAGAVIVLSLAITTAAAGFWLLRIDELQVFTLNAPVTGAYYPMHILPAWLRRMFKGLFPVAFMGYVPLTYALGKGGEPLDLLAPYGVAALALGVSLLFWRWGERHYQSTGS